MASAKTVWFKTTHRVDSAFVLNGAMLNLASPLQDDVTPVCLQSAVSQGLTKRKWHNSPTMSILHFPDEWNTREEVALHVSSTPKYRCVTVCPENSNTFSNSCGLSVVFVGFSTFTKEWKVKGTVLVCLGGALCTIVLWMGFKNTEEQLFCQKSFVNTVNKSVSTCTRPGRCGKLQNKNTICFGSTGFYMLVFVLLACKKANLAHLTRTTEHYWEM